ncbi:pentatricopeptide repeat-containing protein At3g18110, chloroplastic [Selaginella moellendorffii]|uniref:pentatricopeptide repeat-containing protein At3g18110, chloroplastic n=1 Tax=Selaginella moellendorffii TaxID=88036 RepID=UPI000D1C4EDB|nr:pentatricopeptide repeat-containing protein At3g18110, chloroplastic [Selaginella moellendorffii]|eukprot:XP_024528102.1 pentatricopeptide repeat-containing protein At3g18110, chloroplastic [Selaginella moellendorffii]
MVDKANFPLGSVASYNSVLSGFARAHLWSKAESLLAQILHTHRTDSSLVSTSFGLVISSYGKAGMLANMESLFRCMLNEGCSPSTSTFNAMISVYGKALRIPDMEAALQAMLAEFPGVEPNVITWCCLADAYRRAKLDARVDMALEKLLLKPEELDAKAYGLMVDIYGRRKDFQSVERCYRDMVDAGFKPDVSAWTSMVKSFGAAKGRDGVDEILSRVSSSQLEPDARFYLSLLESYRASGSFRKMEEVLRLLKRSKPSKAELVKAANIVLDAYGAKGSIRRMEQTLDEMEDDGIEPDSRTYTALVAGYAKARMVRRMESTFLRMRVACCAPDEFVYNALIDGYASLGMVEEAEQKLAEMSRAGLKASVVELTSVLNSYKNSPHHRARLPARFFQLQREFGGEIFRPDEQTMAVFLSALEAADSTGARAELVECIRRCDSSGTVAKLLEAPCEENEIMDLDGGGRLWNGVERLLLRAKDPAVLCDSLVDVLSFHGLGARASRLLGIAWDRGLLPRLESVRGDAIVLDLHGFSVRVAEVALMLWLSRLESSGRPFGSISIVTGWGRSSKSCGHSLLKSAVEAILWKRELPFAWDRNSAVLNVRLQ